MTKSMQEIIQEAYNEIPQIKPEEALDMQNNGALIIDTREINELAMTGKIKDAVHIPRGLIEFQNKETNPNGVNGCLLYTSPSPRDRTRSRMPSSA